MPTPPSVSDPNQAVNAEGAETPPVQAKVETPDFGAEIGKLREEQAKFRGEFDATVKAKDAEIADLRQRLTQTQAPQDGPKNPEDWDKLFTEKGVAPTLMEFTKRVVNPSFEALAQRTQAQNQKLYEKLAKSQREQIRHLDGVDDTVMAKVDTVMDKLSFEEKAEPGVWTEALERVLDDEQLAEIKMKGREQSRTSVRTRSQAPPDDEGREPVLTADEAKWAKRFKMTPKEYKRFDEDQTVEI